MRDVRNLRISMIRNSMKKNFIFFWPVRKNTVSLQTENNTMRGGAEVARWAHNPKVVGSNPAPATKSKQNI